MTLHPLLASASRHLRRAHAAAHVHPRRVALAVLGLLGGFAVTAFGIAPLAPDAATLPKQVVVQSIQVDGLDKQLDDLALHPLELTRHEVTRASDTVESLLRRLGVADPTAAAFVRSDRDARRLVDGRGNKMVQARAADDGTLLELVARFPALDKANADTHFTRMTLIREQGRWRSMLETVPLVPQMRMGSGSIRTSLWAATDDAQLPDAIARQLIDIFSADLDFHRQLRRGDSFSVLFESLTADDQPITWNDATGRILAAEFVNGGKTHQAVWFQNGGRGKGSYFGLDGKSRQRAFLASPLEFSRVTSGFAMRMHPILQSWRAHNGVDYSAPVGTPVRAIADGLVEFAGRQNGYGNLVKIAHAGGKSTLYAHLSRIDVRVGQRIEQGQLLGAVGATGWATGPHLHFELRVGGQLQDPATMASASSEASTVDSAALPHFQQMAALARQHLDVAESMIGFRGNAE